MSPPPPPRKCVHGASPVGFHELFMQYAVVHACHATACLSAGQVDILCRVVYVDSEGLSDGRSMKNTVLNLAPKMLVVTGGAPRAKASLVSHVRKQLDPDGNGNSDWKGSRTGGSGEGGMAGVGAGGGAGAGGGGDSASGGVDDASRFVVVKKVLEPLPVGLDSGALDVLLHDSLHTQLKWKQVCACPGAREGGRGFSMCFLFRF